jgi:hypothetical protein
MLKLILLLLLLLLIYIIVVRGAKRLTRTGGGIFYLLFSLYFAMVIIILYFSLFTKGTVICNAANINHIYTKTTNFNPKLGLRAGVGAHGAWGCSPLVVLACKITCLHTHVHTSMSKFARAILSYY